jgi:hypothetical protein
LPDSLAVLFSVNSIVIDSGMIAAASVPTLGLTRRTPFILELRNVPFKQQEQIFFYMVDRSYYRKLWIECGDEKGGVAFRVGHANPGGSRVEGDATDARGNGEWDWQGSPGRAV